MHPLLDQFEGVCDRFPTKPATRDTALELTYAGLNAVARGIGQRIATETERPHVGLLFPPSGTCAAAIFGCWYGAKTPVPLNFLLAPAELKKIIDDAAIDLVLTVAPFREAVQTIGVTALVLDVELLQAHDGCTIPSANATELATLVYTSGTSGTPKGVCLSFDNLVQNVNACIEMAEIQTEARFLSLLPQFHTFGFTTNTLVPLLLGATVYYLPRFATTTVVNLIAEQKIDTFITIASMFGALAGAKSVRREQLESLQLAVSGGEPLPTQVADAFQQRFGVTIYEGYGMTEASPVVSLNTRRALRLGSVGHPLPGVSVVAVDEEGRELPAGRDGELVVRGHCVMQGYRNQPELTARTICDGALFTGDVGHVDADGFVFITGRAKDMMIVGGENVFPIEIEMVLLDHPAVAEVAVIGTPDKLRGEMPVAFVLLRTDVVADESELRSFCRSRLAGYKVPRRVTIADKLPRGPTGKILKRALTVPE